jgi:hypothetical protein
MKHLKLLILFLMMFSILNACKRADQDLEEIAQKKYKTAKTKRERRDEKMGGYVFDEPLFSFGDKNKEETNIGVNSYLWRASLDVLSILPKKKIDPFGGVILTEWYVAEENDSQRLKVEVTIIGRQLRAGALRINVFRQEKVGLDWKDRSVSQETIDQFEETILARAREIRVSEEK